MKKLVTSRDAGDARESAGIFVPKRGRPSPQQVAAIDKAIVDAARGIFLDQGYDALAMHTLASDLGISKGTLYTRHPSKEALLRAVVEDIIAGWAAAVPTDESLLNDNIAERLGYHARRIARTFLNPEVSAVQQLMFTTRKNLPHIWEAFYEIGYLYIVNALAEEIEAAADRDEIPVRDADGCARALVGMIWGWHMQETGIRTLTTEDMDAFADRATELILAARSAW